MRFFVSFAVILIVFSGCVLLPQNPPASQTVSSVSDTEPLTDILSIGMISLGDGTVSTGAVGCGDFSVMVPVAITPPRVMDAEEKVKTALALLFAAENSYSESGFYNALAQSSGLAIEKVVFDGDTIRVYITGILQSGGVCDDPRIIEQLRTTVEVHVDESTVLLFINDISIDEYFHG